MNNTVKNTYCRICAVVKPHNELKNLQTDEEMRQKVIHKLSRFNIVMDFQHNILPKTVCLVCLKSLERAFTFVTAVEQAQAYLNDFILVQIKMVESNDENIFYEPPDDDKHVIDIKYESTPDPMVVNVDNSNVRDECDNSPNPMNVNEDNSNVIEECNSEIKSNNNYKCESRITIDNEDYNIGYKHTIQPANVIIKQMINIKGESDEPTDLNTVEDNTKIMVDKSLDISNKCRKYGTSATEDHFNINGANITIPSALVEKVTNNISKEYNSEPLAPKPLDNTVYSEDYINKQINRLSIVPVQHIKMTWMDYLWKCSHCETLFSNIEELQKHSMQYHNSCNAYQCTECKCKKQRLNAFIKHVRSHRKYLHYSCYKCFEKFPKYNETGQHKAKIHEDSNFICLGCNTTFSSESELDVHVSKYYKILWKQKKNIINDNLTCDICKKVCASIGALRYHINRHENKKREHVCDVCGKCFFNEKTLKSHMVTHDNERVLHQCEICNTTFKTVYTLRYHMSLHSGVKPFTCDICGKSFRTKSYIIKHMVSHMDSFPFTCTVCNKKFRIHSLLKNHMRQHTGEKPFACDICSRDFTNLSNRNKHMRRRHGIEMAKKRVLPEPNLATVEVEVSKLDKINECKKKIMVQRNRNRPSIN